VGSGVALITYRTTTNGTVGSWTTYSGAFTISTEGTTTVDAYATDNASNQSDTITTTFGLDQTAPQVSVSVLPLPAAPDGYINNPPATVTLTATDGGSGVASIEYRTTINGTVGNWTPYTVPFNVSIEGTTLIDARATDNAGNQSNPIPATPIRIDTIKPAMGTPTVTPTPVNGWVKTSATVGLSATDVGGSGVASITYRTTINGTVGSWTPYTGPITISDEGTTLVEAYATDNAGNQSAQASTTFGVDKTAPQVSASVNPNPVNGWVKTSATVTLTGADFPAIVGSGVASITYRTTTNGTVGSWTTYTVPFTISTEGTTTVEAYATDNAGNQSTTITTTFSLDKTAPQANASVLPSPATPGGYINTSAAVTLTATDYPALIGSGVASITYRTTLNGGTPSAWTTYSGAFTSSAEGTTIVEAYATDNAGNQSTTISTTVKIDTIKPVMGTPTVTPNPVNGWVKTSATIGLSATDVGSGVASIRYRTTVNGTVGSWTTYSGTFTISTEGTTLVEAYATDNAGNVSATATATVKIDSVLPTATLSTTTADTDGDGLLETTAATYSCADAGSGVKSCELLLDNVVVSSTTTGASTTFTFGTLTSGSHTLTVRATDNAGNSFTKPTTTFASGYRVCLLYDPTVAKSIGSTFAVKLRLCDAAGNNVSSSAIALTALTVDGRLDPGTNDAGNANNGYLFRWVSSDSSYIYNLKTNGLSAGKHLLYFTTQAVPNRNNLPLSPLPTNGAKFALK
jgi:hypothetical protein